MGLFDKIKDLIDRRNEEYYEDEFDEEDELDEDEDDYPEPADLDEPPYSFVDAMRAAAKGNEEKIRDYLKFKPEYAHCRDWDGNTLLHRAALFAQPGVTRLLLEQKAEVNLRYKEKTPLHYLVGTDSTWVKSKMGENALPGHAARQLKTAELLIERGAALDAVDDKGETPLHTAARVGQSELTDLLLRQGAPVDIRAAPPNAPKTARTPLLIVARHNKNRKILEFLLEKGADPNAMDEDPGYTALHYLAAAPHYDNPAKEKLLAACAQSLLKAGAKPDIHSPARDYTPLHLAAANNHVILAEVLLARKADVNARGDKGMTPMSIAASKGSVDMVECLLKHGVDLHVSRALYHAAYCKQTDRVLKLLVERGADINRPDENGVPPLFAAISANSLHNVKFLIEHGADPRVHPPGRTVMQHAFANWGAIEAMPEKDKAKYADDAKGIIELLGGFKSLQKK